jgi:cyanophycin synthetase
MKIKSINIIDGKNKWSESKDKLIHMILDLGEFEEKPSNKIEGFYKRIKEY